MAKKKILIVAGDVQDGLVHQRIHLPFKHIRHEFDFRFKNCAQVTHTDFWYTDAVILVHPSSKRMLDIATICRSHYHIPVIVDLDDALDSVSEDHPYYYLFEDNQVQKILHFANYCVFATKALQQMYEPDVLKSTVIENTLRARNYRLLRHKRPATFTIGWTGSDTHRADIDIFAEAVFQFMSKHKEVMFFGHILCPQKILNHFRDRVTYHARPVDYLDYPKAVSEYPIDVLLVGLLDTKFNKGKSDLKLLEMAPFKIPVIASPRDAFIVHKDKGICLYAEDNTESWFNALEFAYGNREAMNEIADRAYKYALTERTSDKAAESWLKVLTDEL